MTPLLIYWMGDTPCLISDSMGQAIETFPLVVTIIYHSVSAMLGQVDRRDVRTHSVRHLQQLVRHVDTDGDRRTDLASGLPRGRVNAYGCGSTSQLPQLL